MSLRHWFFSLAFCAAYTAHAAVNCSDSNSLFAAAYQKDNAKIKAYQAAQCALDVKNVSGLTLYDIAALTGNSELQALLEKSHAAQKGKYSNALVRLVQTGMRYINYDAGPIDGLYSTATQKAVKAYQKSLKQSPTGAMTSDWLAPFYSQITKQMQKDLNRLGFGSGGADGVIGANTQKAIRAFRKRQKLSHPEFGQIDHSLIYQLMIADNERSKVAIEQRDKQAKAAQKAAVAAQEKAKREAEKSRRQAQAAEKARREAEAKAKQLAAQEAEAARKAKIAAQKAEAARLAEEERRATAEAQAAANVRQAEILRQQAQMEQQAQQAMAQAQIARQQAESARQAELARQAEAARQAQMARQEAEAARVAAAQAAQAEAKAQAERVAAERRAQEERAKQEALARQARLQSVPTAPTASGTATAVQSSISDGVKKDKFSTVSGTLVYTGGESQCGINGQKLDASWCRSNFATGANKQCDAVISKSGVVVSLRCK